MSERELLLLIADGDQEAFRSLFDAYRNKIYTIGLDLTGSPAAAEDVVQDVFLKIWVRRDTLREVTHFRAYLFTTTRNHILELLRRDKLRTIKQQHAQLNKDDKDNYHQGEMYVLEKEYGVLLQKAVERLPQQQERVFRLIREQGMKRAEAAREMGISEDTVKSHFSQAIRNIRAFCLGGARFIFFLLLTHPFR